MELLTGCGLGSVAIFTVLFILLVDLMHRRQRWTSHYPPGPVPLPVLGNLLQVDFNDMPYSLYKLRQRYGDVFSLQMAWRPMVVINGLKVVREVLVNCGEDTSDRPPMPIFQHMGFGHKAKGVAFAPYGPEWREQRRFSVSTMRNFGLGKKSLEQWVTDEAGYLCDALAEKAGQPLNPSHLLNKAVCNVITSLIYARRFEYGDPQFTELLKILEENMGENTGLFPEILNTFPILLRIPGLVDKVFPGQKTFMAMVDNLVNEHRKTRDPAQPPRDLTDAFLAEVEKAKGNPESSFNDANLRLVVSDLFGAGMVTSSITLAWALLLMILHPDVQRRVHQEIDEVIGQGRSPEMADQASMPYTNAVIHEVQRFADIVPINLPHMTSRDIEVQGFLIPKGTTLIPNLSSVLKDETVWEKPLQFHPEHFLDAQGHFVKHEAFMPFSAGRRACLGEPLARMELFLFFTCLLQHFRFSVPDGQPRPSDHGVFMLLSSPSPYELCAVTR
ncbi:cytochrome P450 2D3-like [Peromyscus maniculatus bairdii]|uniref:cytochrome P450 2D3-like n=1 Tax=Peromyscus maniculatus bairdii TaxID=230844 RepID=UPI001C2ED4BD|nr:cytochrome P450 2D3-like [Peromyscus maniculatus bairdii]